MRRTSRLIPFAVGLGIASMAGASPQPVRVTGTTSARGELLRDVLDNIIQFAPAFDCTIASSVRTTWLDSAKIPAGASYRVAARNVAYEEWVADFCGKSVPFLVKLWPDPAGGTNIRIDYPYPAGAPRGAD